MAYTTFCMNCYLIINLLAENMPFNLVYFMRNAVFKEDFG